MSIAAAPAITRQIDEPTWEIAELFPTQGHWSEEDYLALTHNTHRLIELVDGYLEILPMPKLNHQRIVAYLYQLLFILARKIGGEVLFAPLRVYLGPGHFREPDLVFVLSADDPRINREDYAYGADLVIEVVSADAQSQERDYIKKRAAYAHAGILEYWIVDLQAKSVLILILQGTQYIEHGRFTRGETATSPLLPDLLLNVSALFDL